MKTATSVITLLSALLLTAQAFAAESRADQKVSLTVHKSNTQAGVYYFKAEFDYFHSKMTSGPGAMMVKNVGQRAPFVTLKMDIVHTAPDSFGGLARNQSAEWTNTKQKIIFKKLICGKKVALMYELRDTAGMKAKFRTKKTIVKPSPVRTELIAKLCPNGGKFQPMKKLINKRAIKKPVRLPSTP